MIELPTKLVTADFVPGSELCHHSRLQMKRGTRGGGTPSTRRRAAAVDSMLHLRDEVTLVRCTGGPTELICFRSVADERYPTVAKFVV